MNSSNSSLLLLRKKDRNTSLRKKNSKPSGRQKGHKSSTLDKINNPDFVADLELCSCPYCQKKIGSEFSSNVTNPTQYGTNIRALITN